MSLPDVLNLMSDGSIHIQPMGGFSFIQLPDFCHPGQSIPTADRPATFSLISSNPFPSDPPTSPEATTPEAAIEEDPELGPPPDEDPNDNRIADWRAGRRASSMRRKPPGAAN